MKNLMVLYAECYVIIQYTYTKFNYWHSRKLVKISGGGARGARIIGGGRCHWFLVQYMIQLQNVPLQATENVSRKISENTSLFQF